jgi:TRAP-type C4-dicarboxylate transport system permease small subunit
MYSGFQKVVSLVERFVGRIIIVLFVVMLVSCNIQVITRTIGVSASWTEELARYMAVWMTFLGAAYSYRKKAMVAVEMLIGSLKGRNKFTLELLILSIGIVFICIMTFFGLHLAIKVASQTTPILKVPTSFVYSAVPVAGVLMLLFSADRYYDCISEYKNQGR